MPVTTTRVGYECDILQMGKVKAVSHPGPMGWGGSRSWVNLVYPALKSLLSALIRIAFSEPTTPLPLEELIPHQKTLMLNVD